MGLNFLSHFLTYTLKHIWPTAPFQCFFFVFFFSFLGSNPTVLNLSSVLKNHCWCQRPQVVLEIKPGQQYLNQVSILPTLFFFSGHLLIHFWGKNCFHIPGSLSFLKRTNRKCFSSYYCSPLNVALHLGQSNIPTGSTVAHYRKHWSKQKLTDLEFNLSLV